jgi:hypothetical protein
MSHVEQWAKSVKKMSQLCVRNVNSLYNNPDSTTRHNSYNLLKPKDCLWGIHFLFQMKKRCLCKCLLKETYDVLACILHTSSLGPCITFKCLSVFYKVVIYLWKHGTESWGCYYDWTVHCKYSLHWLRFMGTCAVRLKQRAPKIIIVVTFLNQWLSITKNSAYAS